MRRFLTYGIVGVSALAVLYAVSISHADECLSQELPVACFMQKTHRIALDKGVPEALTYAATTVGPYSRNALHMSMHTVGHAAYDSLGSRSEAMKMLPPEASKAGEQLTYDGYQHGVLQAYFLDASARVPVAELMKESCGAWYESDKESVRGEWGRAGLGCFHGIGHALMPLYENDVEKSIVTCRTLPSLWTQEWCAYGVFMEASYQYHPSYGHSALREGDDMSGICARAPALAHICAKFVGHSFLMKKPNDFAGAFKTCDTLSQADAQSCRIYMAEIIFPGLSHSPSTLASWCKLSGPFEKECFFWAASGLSEGFGGTAAMGGNICASLNEEKEVACEAFVAEYKRSLSMHDTS